MKKSKQSKSVFWRYLLSYLIILVLPIGVFTIFIHFRYYAVLQDEIMKNEMNSLEIVQTVSDGQLLQIENLQKQIVLDRDFRPFLLYGNIKDSIVCIKKLALYRGANHLIDEIAIYHNVDEYIYSSQGSYSEKSFLETQYEFDFEQVKESAQKDNPVSVYSASNIPLNRQQKIELTLLTGSLSQNKGIILVFLNKEAFTNVMEENHEQKMSETFILSRNKEVISFLGEKSEVTAFIEDIKKVSLPEGGTFQESRKIKGKEYLFSATISTKTGLTYLSYTPTSNAMVKAIDIQKEMLWLLLLLLVVAFIIISKALHITYHPIKKLEIYAKTVFQEPKSNLDAIQKVEETIKYLESKNTALISSSQKASCEYLLRSLVRGKYTLEEFNQAGKDYGLALNFPLFQVLIIQIYMKNKISNTLIIIEETALNTELRGNFVDGLSEKSYICILNFGYEENNHNKIKRFHKKLQEAFLCDITIGIGEIYNDVKKISESYVQSSHAADYNFVKGKNSIIKSSEVELGDNYMVSYPYNELDKLDHFLEQGAINEVRDSLDSLLLYLKSPNLPMLILRRLCLQIVGIISKSLKNLELQRNPNQAHSIKIIVSEFETVDELLEVMGNISTNICRALEETDSREKELINKLYEYIDKNYFYCNFSLKNMADSFGIQASYLSQYFKGKSNKTVLEYVTRLRMEKAKKLLISTQISVGEIANQVGYISDSSFIRRFKQYTGMTPGQYTKKSKLSAEEKEKF